MANVTANTKNYGQITLNPIQSLIKVRGNFLALGKVAWGQLGESMFLEQRIRM